MEHSLWRWAFAVAGLVLAWSQPSRAFDTKGHQDATRFAAAGGGFSPAATDALVVGNFAPDFYGPIADELLALNPVGMVAKNLPHTSALAYQETDDGKRLRRAGQVLHFDNIHGSLKGKPDLEAMFTCLLHSTRGAIRHFYKEEPGLDAATRQQVILLVLGSSLHMVQDFYSHSNWIDVQRLMLRRGKPSVDDGLQKVRYRTSVSELEPHAPSWFESCGGKPCADFERKMWTGIYPNAEAPEVGLSHAGMNHDSSRTPSEHYKGQTPEEVQRHQHLAVATAAFASREWIELVRQDAGAREALDFAKTLGTMPPGLTEDIRMLSCLVDHWDGPGSCEDLERIKTQFKAQLKGVATSSTTVSTLHAMSILLPKLGAFAKANPKTAVGAAVLAFIGGAAAVDSLGAWVDQHSRGIIAVYARNQMMERLSERFASPMEGRYALSLEACGP